jgi:hypothetical protein
MDAKITGENDERIGMYVDDNNGIEHWIEMEFDGEIKYHEQDGYPDNAAKRDKEGNEHVNQTRRFAQYYVYVDRGYDTVPSTDHPERINAVRLAIQELSDTEFETLFGELHTQMLSYHEDVDRVIPVPSQAAGQDSVLYRQNVYLGIDPLETDIAVDAADIASAYDLELSEDTLKQSLDDLSAAAIEDWQSVTGEIAELTTDEEIELESGVYLDAVSSLYASYLDDHSEVTVTDPETDPFDRDPDTLIELPPINPGPLAEFQEYLDHHLKCQIRDCFIGMGVEPPEQFRVLGNGRLKATVAYTLLNMYPEYHDPDNQQLLENR